MTLPSMQVNQNVLAIDIGGTLVKLGVVDPTGCVHHSFHIDTRASRGAHALFDELAGIAQSLVQPYALAGVAVSTLGVIDTVSGTVRGASDAIPGYLGLSPKQLLWDALQMPVLVENDVNCVALAEGWLGAAQGVENFVALTLGTGIGGGVFMGSQLYRGAHAAAGEWGYMVVGGERWEDVASLRGLGRLGARAIAGCTLDAKAIFERADAGSVPHAAVVQEWLELLASGLANLIYAFDPQCIVLGGGITGRGPRVLAEIQAALDALLHPDFVGLQELRLAAAGNHAGLLGAARAWFLAHPAGLA
ncbi:ROK family protein [Rhodoferax aquaticus]|nr:ROK family protein [Rhodoferax aquaticus]